MGATTRFVRRERPRPDDSAGEVLQLEEPRPVTPRVGGTHLIEYIGIHDVENSTQPNLFRADSLTIGEAIGLDNQLTQSVADTLTIGEASATILAHNRFVSESLTMGETVTLTNPELNITEADTIAGIGESVFVWETLLDSCVIPDHEFDAARAGSAAVGCNWSTDDIVKYGGNPNTVATVKTTDGIEFYVTTAGVQDFIFGTIKSGYFSADLLKLTNHLSDVTFLSSSAQGAGSDMRLSQYVDPSIPSTAATGLVDVCFYRVGASGQAPLVLVDCQTLTHYEISANRWQSTLQASAVPSLAVWCQMEYYCEGGISYGPVVGCKITEAHLTSTS